MVFRIVGKVALLAKGAKVGRIAVLRRVIKVCDSQNNLRPVLFDGVVLHPTELATIIRTDKNLLAYLLPVFRIARFIFGSNRHFSFKLLKISELCKS